MYSLSSPEMGASATVQPPKMANTHLCSLRLQFLLLLSILGNGVSLRYLPGLDAPLPSELETGYVNVDESNGIELFYYFFESENSPAEDPLLVWFTGGPGCSGLSAILFENGPVKIKTAKYDGKRPTLYLNKYSWTKLANLLYIDAPVGTGFSYSSTKEGAYADDIIASNHGYNFIKKWLTDHPKFLTNSLYIGGDSYAGKIVPIVSNNISNGLLVGAEPLINFKGYLLGNPITDQHLEGNSAFQFAYGMGLISKELFESAKRTCNGEYVNVDDNNTNCIKDLQALSESTEGLNDENILEPKCVEKFGISLRTMTKNKRSLEDSAMDNIISPQTWLQWKCEPEALTSKQSSMENNLIGDLIFRPPISNIKCKSYGYMLSYYWANDAKVLKALKVRKGKVHEWLRCNRCGINYTERVVQTATPYHSNISTRHYRSLIYSGDYDKVVPFLSTQEWIKSLKYSISDDWRPWLVTGQVAGYTRTYKNNMTFATVKGAGHIALEYKPKESFSMFKRWLSNKDL